MAEQFWKLEPREPWKDWRTYSMLGPIVCGALGACIFFALGLAFAEIVNIRPGVRKPLIFMASFGVAVGATFGSIGSGIEVFRKAYKKQATGWDWTSLSVSTVTTIVGMIIGVATLLGGTTDWSREAVIWGSAVVCGFAALDAGGDMIELGGLFGSFEERYEQWLDEREQWRQSTGQLVNAESDQVNTEIERLNTEFWNLSRQIGGLVEEISSMQNRWAWPVASKADVDRVLAKVNGAAGTIDRAHLAVILAKEHLNLPATTGDSTVKRWLRMAGD